MIDSEADGPRRPAWIQMIERSDATGRLREFYDRWHRPDGDVDNILKIHSLNPESLKGHYEFYRGIMAGRSPLSRAQREMIAVVVSTLNSCHY
jgi:alkylhydroperoxidase family enzyme